jgi:predicted kinase
MELIMLCGIPTSGKSTYVKTLLAMPYWENAVVISTDNYIQRVAEEQNKTYDDVFKSTISKATSHMDLQLKLAIRDGKDIIIDQTNLTRKSRKNKTSKVPADMYRKRAVYFVIPLKEALERNKHRPGKVIPESVLTSMYHSFEVPNNSEDFETIERGN